VNKPLHPPINPEILVKIGPVDSEKQPVESRPLKKYEMKKKTLSKYIALFGKFAERAKKVRR